MRRRLAALRCHVQRHSKYLCTLLIIVRVALVASQVRVLQGVERHTHVRRFLILCLIVATMTGAAALFARVDAVPFALVCYRMRGRVACTA